MPITPRLSLTHARSRDKLWPPAWGRGNLTGKVVARPLDGRISTRKTRREARWDRPAAEGLSLHGKEGVDGSSPSEGLNYPQMRA